MEKKPELSSKMATPIA
jgi:hypothetical protein